MFESLRDFIIFDNWPARIVAIIMLPLLIAGFNSDYQVVSWQILDILYITLSAGSIILYYLFLLLKITDKGAFIDDMTDPLLIYGILFSLIYWVNGDTNTPYLEFVSSNARIIFLFKLILVTGVSHFYKINKTSLKEVEKEESQNNYILPKAYSMTYFSKTIGEIGLIVLPLLYGTFIIISAFINDSINSLISGIVILLFILFTILLSYFRNEILFWSGYFLLIILSFVTFIINQQILPSLILFVYFLLLFGLSILYTSNNKKQHFKLVALVLVFYLINIFIEKIDIFRNVEFQTIIIGLFIPFLAALFGAYVSNVLSKKDLNIESFLTVDEVSETLSVSKQKVYNLINRGDLQAIKIGRCWRIEKKWLNRYIESRQVNNT